MVDFLNTVSTFHKVIDGMREKTSQAFKAKVDLEMKRNFDECRHLVTQISGSSVASFGKGWAG